MCPRCPHSVGSRRIQEGRGSPLRLWRRWGSRSLPPQPHPQAVESGVGEGSAPRAAMNTTRDRPGWSGLRGARGHSLSLVPENDPTFLSGSCEGATSSPDPRVLPSPSCASQLQYGRVGLCTAGSWAQFLVEGTGLGCSSLPAPGRSGACVGRLVDVPSPSSLLASLSEKQWKKYPR